jgi:hypothetical protein
MTPLLEMELSQWVLKLILNIYSKASDAGFGTNGGFKGTNFDDFIVGTSNNENYFWYGIFGLDWKRYG